MRCASLTSTRWLSLVVALAVGLVCAAPAGADRAPRREAGAQAVGPAAGHGPFAGRVAIRGGRRLYLECRGSGRPTVMLEAGSGNLGSIWTEPRAEAEAMGAMAPVGPGRAILPAVARFTRVCAYDRPGTYRYPDTFSRSDPVAMPRTTLDIVRDLHALLRAAGAPRPFVLAGHSFGGMVARLYATNHPRAVAGLVSVDAQNEDYAAAFKRLSPPDVYAAYVLDPQPPPGLSYPALELLALEASAAQMRQAQADTPLRPMPFTVLSHSRTIPNPFGLPPEFPAAALERAFQDSQDMLARLVPGAKHVIATKSTHYIQLYQPRLVTDAIHRVVRKVRRR